MAEIENPITPEFIDSANKYTAVLDKTAKKADELADRLIKLQEANNKSSASDSNAAKKKKELTEIEKELDRVISQTEKNIAKRQIAEAGLTKELVESQLASQKAAKAVKDKLQAEEKAAKQAKLAAEALNKQRTKALQVIAKQEQAEKDLREALEREVKTEEDAIIQNKALRQARRKLDSTTQEGTEAVEALNERINKNSEFLAGNADAATAAKDNIGKYQESIEAALSSSDKFSGGTTNIISNFVEIGQSEGGISGFFKTFVSGIGSATKAGLKFILTPIGAVIAAIVVGIGLFTAAISRNEAASDGFQKIWAGISNVIEEVVGRVFKLIGAIGKFIRGDWSGAINNASEAFTGLGEAMDMAFKEGQKLLELQIALKETTIKNTKAIAEQNAIAEKQNTIADDATRSFAEREAAAEKARVAESEAASLRVEQSRQALEIINLQVKQAERQGTINRELRQEQADLNAEFIDSESALTVAILNNDKTRAELKQDRLEKDLDILIDGFDNQKTINERLIADDELTLGKRAGILNNTRDLFEKTFAKQIETIEEFTNINVNANDLIATSDAVVLNEKIRSLGLSEIIEGRLLEIIRERRIATQDLNEAEKTLNKERLDVLKSDRDLELQIEEDLNSEILAEDEKIKEEQKKNQKELTDFIVAEEKRAADLRIQIERQLQDAKIGLQRQALDAAFEIGSLFLEREIERDREKAAEQREEELESAEIKNEDDLASIQDRFDSEILSEDEANAERIAVNNKFEAEKDRIAKESEAREKSLASKEAKIAAANAISQIAIDTAQKVAAIKTTAAALLANPLTAALAPIALAQIPVAIGSAAIQTGVVLANQIPKFFKGAKSTPDTFIAGDSPSGGLSEMIIKRNGEMFMTPDKPTLYSNMRGAEVVPNHQVKERLAEMGVKEQSFNINMSGVVDKISETNKLLKRQPKVTQGDGYTTSSFRNNHVKKHESFTKRLSS